jgi:hypothetical protein
MERSIANYRELHSIVAAVVQTAAENIFIFV